MGAAAQGGAGAKKGGMNSSWRCPKAREVPRETRTKESAFFRCPPSVCRQAHPSNTHTHFKKKKMLTRERKQKDRWVKVRAGAYHAGFQVAQAERGKDGGVSQRGGHRQHRLDLAGGPAGQKMKRGESLKKKRRAGVS